MPGVGRCVCRGHSQGCLHCFVIVSRSIVSSLHRRFSQTSTLFVRPATEAKMDDPGSTHQEEEMEGSAHIDEVLPKSGLIYSEKGEATELLCKPKIMPLKSITLEKIEQMEKEAIIAAKQGNTDSK